MTATTTDTAPSLIADAAAARARLREESARKNEELQAEDRHTYLRLLAEGRVAAASDARIVFGDGAGLLAVPATWTEEVPAWGALGDWSPDGATPYITLYAVHDDPQGGTYLFVWGAYGKPGLGVAVALDDEAHLLEWMNEERPWPFDVEPFEDAAQLGDLLERTRGRVVLSGPPSRPLPASRAAEMIREALELLSGAISEAGGRVTVQEHPDGPEDGMVVTIAYEGADGAYCQHWVVQEVGYSPTHEHPHDH